MTRLLERKYIPLSTLQAYTVELESLVTHLEEENAVLLQLAVCMYLSIYAFSVLSCLYNILFSLVG